MKKKGVESRPLIRAVWSHNLEEELSHLGEKLTDYPVVSLDTEFPCFIRWTPKGIPAEELYEAVRYNVDRLNVIQIGLTLADERGKLGGVWEFNFGGFNSIDDNVRVPLKFDLAQLATNGIEPEEFARQFLPITRSGRISRWVTFHGFYDVAYLLKILGIKSMPDEMAKFASLARHMLGTVSDLKHMARHCHGLLNGELGLQRMSELLHVQRVGTAHHAGSDSLLTASVYAKIREKFELPSEDCEGYLYGLPNPIGADRKPVTMSELPHVRRTAHRAGSESLLTASVYAKMREKFELPSEDCEGYLYGLPNPIGAGSDSLLTTSVYAKIGEKFERASEKFELASEKFELASEDCEGYLYGLPNPIGADRKPVTTRFAAVITVLQRLLYLSAAVITVLQRLLQLLLYLSAAVITVLQRLLQCLLYLSAAVICILVVVELLVFIKV